MTFQIFKFRVLAIALFMMATVSVNAQELTQMALQSLNFSVMSPHAEQTENLLEDAEQTINQMEQKDANQSDVCTLRGFLYMVRIVQNPRMVSVTI